MNSEEETRKVLVIATLFFSLSVYSNVDALADSPREQTLLLYVYTPFGASATPLFEQVWGLGTKSSGGVGSTLLVLKNLAKFSSCPVKQNPTRHFTNPPIESISTKFPSLQHRYSLKRWSRLYYYYDIYISVSWSCSVTLFFGNCEVLDLSDFLFPKKVF